MSAQQPELHDSEALATTLAAHQTSRTVMGGWITRNGEDSDRHYGWSCVCGARSPDAFKVDLTAAEADAGRFGHVAEVIARPEATRREKLTEVAAAIRHRIRTHGAGMRHGCDTGRSNYCEAWRLILADVEARAQSTRDEAVTDLS